MAEFCEKCLLKIMGLKPSDRYAKYWLVANGGICEECRYSYLDEGDA